MKPPDNELIYTARWIFPICQPAIHGGYVRVAGGKIVQVGSLADRDWAKSKTIDLGDVALLPRMVNAHTHLEFSDCESVIGQRGIPLADWIGQVLAARGRSSTEQRQQSIAKGIDESVKWGVGLIGEIATTPAQYPKQSDLQIVSLAEVLGLSSERADDRFKAAEEHVKSLAASQSAIFGVSPHAPYSTPMSLVQRCVDLAVRHNSTLAMHVAESRDERELLESGSGRFANALRAAGFWQDQLFPWDGRQPLSDLIVQLAQAPRALLVHGNDLNNEEIELIAKYPQLTVVYCPRTHHFFGYSPHRVDELLAAGIRVALGTDSRASNPDLSVWKEFQFLLEHRTDLDPCDVLQMATQCGADALLGAGSGFGIITPGSGGIESLVAVATNACKLDQVWRDFAEQELLCSESFLRA